MARKKNSPLRSPAESEPLLQDVSPHIAPAPNFIDLLRKPYIKDDPTLHDNSAQTVIYRANVISARQMLPSVQEQRIECHTMTSDERLRLERQAATRHQLQMNAPRCWMELRRKLNITADTYQTATLKAPQCDLEIKFSQDEPKITYQITNTHTGIFPAFGTFSFVMQEHGVCLQLEAGKGIRSFDKTGVPLTVDEVAKFLLDKLV